MGGFRKCGISSVTTPETRNFTIVCLVRELLPNSRLLTRGVSNRLCGLSGDDRRKMIV
jgi:hypothetical protein